MDVFLYYTFFANIWKKVYFSCYINCYFENSLKTWELATLHGPDFYCYLVNLVTCTSPMIQNDFTAISMNLYHPHMFNVSISWT